MQDCRAIVHRSDTINPSTHITQSTTSIKSSTIQGWESGKGNKDQGITRLQARVFALIRQETHDLNVV